MLRSKRICLGLLLGLVLASGCGRAPNPPGKVGKVVGSSEVHDHSHGPGPHGGVVFDFGRYHAELTIDHDRKECTIYFLGANARTPKAVAAQDLTLVTKETKTKEGKVVAAMTIQLVAKDEKDGKATQFVGSDPGLGNVADFEGTLQGKVDGKPTQGEFKEE